MDSLEIAWNGGFGGTMRNVGVGGELKGIGWFFCLDGLGGNGYLYCNCVLCCYGCG